MSDDRRGNGKGGVEGKNRRGSERKWDEVMRTVG